MIYLRRLILAAVLMAGFTPAFAQAPAAVPALPDTERRTSYSISASTCACAVNFALYGDSTDYQNWVEVFINGVRYDYNDASHGWTISSPSGSLGTLARPITNAVLTFNAVQTGTVQIVGARRPRRTSQFTENAGITARQFNQVLTDIISQNREIWDKTNDMTGRGIWGQPGDTFSPLPPPLTRASKVLGFTAAGDITTYDAASAVTSSANVTFIQPDTGAVAQTVQDKLRQGAVTPEDFGAKADGSDDGPEIDAAMLALSLRSGGGTLQLNCGKTYTISSISGNGQALIRLFSNVNIVGCGPSSIIKMANGVNTSSASFAYGLSNTNTLSNVLLANFTVDMNGANNSCSGTCYHSNAAIAAVAGDNINLRGITFKNNPGSNDTVFGSNVDPPTVTNLTLDGLVHENSGDRVNAASTDWSGDFFIATNVTYSNIRHSSGPTVNGSAFELHGTNITASNIAVTDHFNCGIIANESTGLAVTTKNVNLSVVSCNNVKGGVQVYSKASATETNVRISNLDVNYLSGSSGIAVDACSNMNASSGTNTNLSVAGVVINSDVTTNLGNEAPGVSACRWASINITNVQGTNIQGPGILIDNISSNAAITLGNSQFTNPGRTGTAANQVAVRFVNTSGNTASNININGVTSVGTVVYNISSNVNATQATIDPGSLASGASTGQWNWTGTGIAGLIFPQVVTNFRGTGGTGQFLKQASLAGQITVSAPTISEIAGLAANCATFLATSTSANLASCVTDETGTAGSVVFSASPALTGTPTAPTAAVDTSTTQLATTAFVLGQAAAATPSADTTAGSVGTSTRYARADHTHPAHNTYSQQVWSAGNLNAMTQSNTWYFSASNAVTTETAVSVPMSQAGTIDKLYCSTQAAPAAGQTFTITVRKNAADTALTCQITSAGTTCNDTTHSFSVAAADLIAIKNVTSATSGTANGMNCGTRMTTTSP